MGIQKNIKKLQEQVEILGSALTRTLKELDDLKTLSQGILTAFQIHIGKDEWNKIIEELKNLENRNVESKLEKK